MRPAGRPGRVAREPSPARLAQPVLSRFARVSPAGARQGRGAAPQTGASLGTLVRDLARVPAPPGPRSPVRPQRAGQGAKAESCQASGLICTRFPKAFGAPPIRRTGPVPGPGQFRAGLPWWAPDELSSCMYKELLRYA